MSEDLFSIAEEQAYDELKTAGAWPVWNPKTGHWRLPDGSVVIEAEALAWLRARSVPKVKGDNAE